MQIKKIQGRARWINLIIIFGLVILSLQMALIPTVIVHAQIPNVVFTSKDAEYPTDQGNCPDYGTTHSVSFSGNDIHFIFEVPAGDFKVDCYNAIFSFTGFSNGDTLKVCTTGDYPDQNWDSNDLFPVHWDPGGGGTGSITSEYGGRCLTGTFTGTTQLQVGYHDSWSGRYNCNGSHSCPVSHTFDYHVFVAEVNGVPAIFSTPLPAATLPCVTITPRPTSTHLPTPTAFALTPVPTATRGAATPAPGLTYKNGPAKFDVSLSPWTVGDSPPRNDAFTFTGWSSADGHDGNPGFAEIGDSFSFTIAPDSPNVIALPDALIFSYPSGIPSPIRITGEAKVSTDILVGAHVYLRVWYLDPDSGGSGNASWVSSSDNDGIEQSSTWRNWDYTIPQNAITSTTALALTWWSDGAVNSTPQVLQVDNIEINAGKAAVDTSYPICTGTGGSGSQPPAVKQCKITQEKVDVFNQCPPPGPSDYLNVGAWLAFLWCRVSVYFTFNSTNIQQLLGLQATQQSAEPFGTMLDFVGALGVLKDTLGDLERTNLSHFVSNRTLDFGAVLDWHALDQPFAFGSLSSDTSYLTQCDELIRNISSNAQRTACFVVQTVRTRAGLLNLFQWAIDLGGLLWFIQYVHKSFGPPVSE